MISTNKTAKNTLRQLILLLSIFALGMFLLISLHLFFINLIENLDKKTENLKSKIEIGEYIVNDIYKVRSDFYELTTTITNKRGKELVNNRILQRLEMIKESLKVLEHGGSLKRVLRLNIVGHDTTSKVIKYKKNSISFSLEAIDLLPKILEFKKMLKTLNSMLDTQYNYRENEDTKNFMIQNRKIKRFYKSTPAFFIRITENANGLLYEGAIELEKIEKQIERQKNYYTNIELILIIMILFIAIIVGIVIALQIDKNTKLLIRQEKFTRGTLDAQDNIVIVSDGEKMIDANNALIEFFDSYNNFKDFESKHRCICDFFEKVEGQELIDQRIYKEMYWFEYIIQHPLKSHRVAMKKNNILNYFLITATKKEIDEKNFIVIVTLNNITQEIEIQKELEKLNENLEDLVDEKTKELTELNENLEKRIDIEVLKNREKERTLIQQSRFAALGEMLGNIAHQWRQPLSAISSTVTSMQVQRNLQIASDQDIDKAFSSILKYVDFLNQTIEDFRGYFKEDKQRNDFNIIKTIKNAILITSATYKDNDIKLYFKYNTNKEYLTHGMTNELTQVILNILNNAKDVLIEKKINEKVVKIEVFDDKNLIIIKIYDNAHGINEQIKEKIFDPYFTTKHKSQGTGIGLYMSKNIIEKNMNGSLKTDNSNFEYLNKKYFGACFVIELPKV